MGRRPPTARLDGAPERRQAEPTDQPPARDLLIGAVIRDQYRLVERIGEGGMGVIYRAEHIQTGEARAIKLLHPELGRLTELVKRFEREAESVSRLSHPNIVKVVETGRLESGAVFLVMELLHGASLAHLLDEHARLPVDRAVAILQQVLSALDHAHGLGVIHRDLKPDNIILLENPRDTVRILDFGIAKLREGSTESEMIKLTKAGIVLGTPAYMSPEQASGNPIDHRSDLYTCGVVLFEMLTGVKPFVADKTMDVMLMHTSKEPPTPRSVAPTAGIPEALEAIVMRALEKDRDRRFGSAAEFLVALNQFGRSRAKQRQRRRLRIGALSAAAVAAACTLLLLVHRKAPAPAVAAAAPAKNGEQVERYLAQLTEAPTCAEKRDALTRLRELGDASALEGLRAARSAKGLAKLHRCLTRSQVDQTIRAIEGR